MSAVARLTVRRLDGSELERHMDSFVALLVDAVESGASVGFLAPLADDVAGDYWRAVREALEDGHRILLGAFAGEALLGSVQLDLVRVPNGRHRAEVMKLFVLRAARSQGVGQALMGAIEDQARAAGRQLLVLDTRVGDAAERLYARLGYTSAGVVPRYARSSTGALEATVFMYRWLE